MLAPSSQGVARRGYSSIRGRSGLGNELGAEAEEEHEAALDVLRAMPDAEALAALRDYLIAATAKDCAIMISFRMGCRPKSDLSLAAPDPSTSTQESKGGKGGSAMRNATIEAFSKNSINNNNGSSSCGMLQSACDEPCIQYKVRASSIIAHKSIQ